MTINKSPHNYPFPEVIAKLDEIAATVGVDKFDFYQKFTCAECGNRLTIDAPNLLFKTGTCDKCKATTDIEKTGCNYMLHFKCGRYATSS